KAATLCGTGRTLGLWPRRGGRWPNSPAVCRFPLPAECHAALQRNHAIPLQQTARCRHSCNPTLPTLNALIRSEANAIDRDKASLLPTVILFQITSLEFSRTRPAPHDPS